MSEEGQHPHNALTWCSISAHVGRVVGRVVLASTTGIAGAEVTCRVMFRQFGQHGLFGLSLQATSGQCLTPQMIYSRSRAASCGGAKPARVSRSADYLHHRISSKSVIARGVDGSHRRWGCSVGSNVARSDMLPGAAGEIYPRREIYE